MPSRFDPDNRNKSGLFDPALSVEGHTDEHLAGANVNQQVPPGALVMWTGSKSTIPSGWLLADGRNMSRQEYAALFEAIGDTYGSGDGSTTFGIPDMRGRFPFGHEAGKATLGDAGGEWDHDHAPGTLEIGGGGSGGHSHVVAGSSGNAGGHTHASDGTHSHGSGSLTTSSSGNTATVNTGVGATVSDNDHAHAVSGTTGSGGGHTHGSEANHSHGGGSYEATTGTSAHNHGSGAFIGLTGTQNPPYLTFHFIIKT